MALSKVLGGVLSLAAGAGIALLAFGGACMVGCDSAGTSPDSRQSATPAVSSAGTGESRNGTSERVETPALSVGDLSENMLGQTVTVEGEVTKQCPASGCWFQVKDQTGEAFISLLATDVRLKEKVIGQRAEVTGEVVKQGGDLAIKAQNVEFKTKL